MFFVLLVALLTSNNAILGELNIDWAWSLSYALNFTFITLILNTGIAAPIETRITKSEEELRKLAETLEQKVVERTLELETVNKELKAFSYSVSHDLRAPLRRITGFNKIILEDYSEKLDEMGKDYLRRVCEGCDEMGELIEGLLQLAKITRTELKKEQVNLSLLAKKVASELQETYPDFHGEFINC